jgi:hypothetical protein
MLIEICAAGDKKFNFVDKNISLEGTGDDTRKNISSS